MKDFKDNQGHYYVDDDTVTKWNDKDALSGYMLAQFEKDPTYTQDDNFPIAASAYFKKHLFLGKSCTFCEKTSLWNIDTKPHMDGGILQLTTPDHVIEE